MDVHRIAHRHPTVIFQRLGPVRLYMIAYERDTTDLYSLRGGEKGHVHGVPVKGVDQAAPLQDQIADPGLSGLQRTGDTYGASTDNYQVVVRTHSRRKNMYIHP